MEAGLTPVLRERIEALLAIRPAPESERLGFNALRALVQSLVGEPVDIWARCGHLLLHAGHFGAVLALHQEARRCNAHSGVLDIACGKALLSMGHDFEAEQLLRLAGASSPADEDLAFTWAVALRKQGRFQAGVQVLMRFAEHVPNDMEAVLRTAELLLTFRAQAAVLQLCNSAIERGFDDPRLLKMAGRMEQVLGNFERARARLDLAAEKLPDDCGILQLLARCQRYEDPRHPDLKRFAIAWRREDLPDEERQLAGFALGHALQDLGELGEAVAVLRKANDAVAGARPWDQQTWARFVDAQCRLEIPIIGSATTQMPTPVFVVGMPRSGTTLLADRLARSPDVCNRGELNWIPYLFGQLQSLNQLNNNEAIARAAARYRRFLLRDEPLRHCYIDKNPLNFRFLKFIDAMLPGARIILCRRNPRDTALSLWSELFAFNDNDYAYRFQDIAAFMQGYSHLIEAVQGRLRAPILTLEYEELVADPKNVIGRVGEFLGLPRFNPESPLADTQDAVGTASLWQVRQPVYSRSVERWRRYERHLPELLTLIPNAL